MDMESYFENLKRKNYYDWKKRQNLIGPVETYESWKTRRKPGTSSEIIKKTSRTKHRQSNRHRKRKKASVPFLRGDRFVDRINEKVKVDSYKAMSRVFDEELNKIFK